MCPVALFIILLFSNVQVQVQMQVQDNYPATKPLYVCGQITSNIINNISNMVVVVCPFPCPCPFTKTADIRCLEIFGGNYGYIQPKYSFHNVNNIRRFSYKYYAFLDSTVYTDVSLGTGYSLTH